MAEVAQRTHPLDGSVFGASGVSISPAADAHRVSLRAPASAVAGLSRALGVALPRKPKTTSSSKSGRLAAWLGPDEWIIIDEGGKNPADDVAKLKAFHSAVDISHRNVAIIVDGPRAELTLNGGCPQDLSLQAFPVGAASRTVLGKAEVILIRVSETSFRVECWRSFSDYVFTLLSESARGAPAS